MSETGESWKKQMEEMKQKHDRELRAIERDREKEKKEMEEKFKQ